ncbi:hypothetical protein NLG97_g1184 [Lecanicillium saksenae]|uniref:Uncharacterized protein n=1 Tax=Lecanicillium saksenae TaxID=468837 RepID=A0ACC1R746_9HYPO|nr:hypothetical protein NLG97_g1184 [Lecanicillium saksenae]
MEPMPCNRDLFPLQSDLDSFEFMSTNTAAGQQPGHGSNNAFAGTSHQPSAGFTHQPPTSVSLDTGRHCINCGFRQPAAEATDARLQTLRTHVERLEMAVVQLQLSFRSSMLNFEEKLANSEQNANAKFSEFTSLVAQLKKGMGKFFERFAEQFSDTEKGSNGGEDTP